MDRERKSIYISQLGYFQKYKICTTCNIIRPLRTTHCGTCDNCILRLDHHCPWIGTCVGKRNYHYFFFFLIFLNLTQIFVGIFSIIFISTKIAHDVKNYKKNNLYKKKEIQVSFCNVTVAIWIVCYVAISMIFTTGLLIFHIKIIKDDKTTKEELKKIFKNPFLNPFQRDTKTNLKNILIPNISKNSVLDELKKNKKKYEKYIKMNKQNKEDKNQSTDMYDISVEIDNDISLKKEKTEYKEKKDKKNKKEKKKNNKNNKKKINENKNEQRKTTDKKKDKRNKKFEERKNNNNNENKSSNSADVTDIISNDNINPEGKKEKGKNVLISPNKEEEDEKKSKTVENDYYNDNFPPPSNINLKDDNKLHNKKNIFKRINK